MLKLEVDDKDKAAIMPTLPPKIVRGPAKLTALLNEIFPVLLAAPMVSPLPALAEEIFCLMLTIKFVLFPAIFNELDDNLFSITLAAILAVPLTESVLPEILQLVPDVPV